MVKFSYGFEEKEALAKNVTIAGVDEVGRGCLAGPVYAAAVILNLSSLFALKKHERSLIRDSKTLSKKQREKSLEIISSVADKVAIGVSEVCVIEKVGIVSATFCAMMKAITKLDFFPDHLFVDGNKTIPGYKGQQVALVKGDGRSYSIAAASIVAKQARDKMMIETASKFCYYGFENNVGYGTREHLTLLKKNGPCALHRRNFEPIKSMLYPCS